LKKFLFVYFLFVYLVLEAGFCSIFAASPQFIRLATYSNYSEAPENVSVNAMSWVLGLGYTLSPDDRYLNYDVITAVFDDRSGETYAGWISIVDELGDEWIQQEIVTDNITQMTAITKEVSWKRLRDGGIQEGGELDIRRVWLHRVYENPLIPEEVYIGIYAGADIVMGQVYDLNIFRERDINSLEIGESAPEIRAIKIDDKLLDSSDGNGFVSGDFVSSLPHIEATIEDNEESIVSWNMQLTKGGAIVVSASGTVVTPNDSYVLDYTPVDELESGNYLLRIQAQNDIGHVGEKSLEIDVESGMQIKGLISGPLPIDFKESELWIEYQLSSAARVDLRIYDIAGEMQKQIVIEEGSVGGIQGFNRVQWDGVNQFNELVSNGPYVIYMQAENDKGKAMAKSKFIVKK
jgi:hypothetical protein